MAKKAKAIHARHPVIYPDTVRPPMKLPDAASLLTLELPLSENELEVVRMAMAINSASRQPKLTWSGWRYLAMAVDIGARYARKAARGRDDTPDYRQVMTPFLRATGLTFVNKDDRAAAVRMLADWDGIDAWRAGLSKSRQQALNNPREVWRAYHEDRRGDPKTKGRPVPSARKHRQYPNALEQIEALEEQLQMAEEKTRQAEHASEIFAAMLYEVAKRHNISEDQIAEIRAKVRAAHEAEPESDSGE